MHGGVAGVGRQLPPLCRSSRHFVQVHRVSEFGGLNLVKTQFCGSGEDENLGAELS
jgi:hypothetical protein